MRSEKTAEPLTDTLKMRNYLEFVLRDARPGPTRGRIVKKGKAFNTVTFGGRGYALARLTPGSTGYGIIQAMALGSNSATAAATSQTALVSYMTIKTFNGGTTLSTSTSAACTFSAAISFASTETWTNSSQIGEFALYNSTAAESTGGSVMFNRIVSSGYINFASTNTLAITISITN